MNNYAQLIKTLEKVSDIGNCSKKSGFHKHHVPLLYEFTTETSVRKENLSKLKTIAV